MSIYWRLAATPLDGPAQRLFAVVLAVHCCVVLTSDSSSWSYHHNDHHGGPNHWSERYRTCGQGRQSPVRISSVQPAYFSPFQGYLLDRTLVLRNAVLVDNGHAAELQLPERTYELMGGGLPLTYYAAGVHFHWGPSNFHGSEHVIPNSGYALEMHIIHYKSSYKSIREAKAATDDPAALAVVGILFEANSILKNADFSPIVAAVKSLSGKTPTAQAPVSTVIPHVHFGSLVGKAIHSGFYRYSGSLTTPPCSEIVLWTVFQRPIRVSAAQVRPFRTLRDSHGDYLTDNIRPLQPVGSRNVYYSPKHVG